MKKVTLVDIAKELGLSPNAVSRALSNHCGNTRISAETKRRVIEVAERLNYKTHAAARTMRTSRFNNIGFSTIQRSRSDYSFTESMLEGISDVASENGQNIVYVQLPRTPERFDEIPRALREQCLDSLVVCEAADVRPEFQKAIEEAGIPVVYLNEKKAENSVYIDDVAGARCMTNHLIGQGYRKISMLVPIHNGAGHYSFEDRVEGYEKAMYEAGLAPEVKHFHNKTLLEEAAGWLTSSSRPEVVFCYSDIMAMALQRALYALHIRIPEDMAVAGYDGEEQALRSTIPLTTMEVPFRSMAAHACRMALDLVNHPGKKTVPSLALTPKLIISMSSDRNFFLQKPNPQ